MVVLVSFFLYRKGFTDTGQALQVLGDTADNFRGYVLPFDFYQPVARIQDQDAFVFVAVFV